MATRTFFIGIPFRILFLFLLCCICIRLTLFLQFLQSVLVHTNEQGIPGTKTSIGAFRKIVNEVQAAMDEDQLPLWLAKGLQEHGAA